MAVITTTPPVRKRITEILETETGGKSYKAHKYSLDNADRPNPDYGDVEKELEWSEYGETKHGKNYVDLTALSRGLPTGEGQLLTYFLDGSRHVFKVDDMGYDKGSRSVIYPIIAGQIGVGCCVREDRRVRSEQFIGEIALAVPDIADADGSGDKGFFQGLATKIRNGSTLASRLGTDWSFSRVFSYESKDEDKAKFEDRGTAKIQDEMIELEQQMVRDLVAAGKLNQDHYLIKDGSLEYRPSANMRRDSIEYKRFKNRYDFVLGVSKGFNPTVCKDTHGKANPGFIADLKLCHRTPVAKFTNPMLGDIAFAVWYIRIHSQSQTRSPFDGIVKVEKILVSDSEVNNGMDSDLVNLLSAYLINERNPVCYGTDQRWANHLYPVYLTEQYVKSRYISQESFLHMF
jgi:hypothetical protein